MALKFTADLGQYKAEYLDNGLTLAVWALKSGTWADGVRVGGMFAAPQSRRDYVHIEQMILAHAKTLPDDAAHGWYDIETTHALTRHRWQLAREAATV